MYINSYKYIYSDNLELPDLGNNSLNQIQPIEEIKNFLKRSAEEFEAKELLKKTKLVSSTHISNLSYHAGNDISYIEQVKPFSSNTNEVSKLIDKEIEFLYAQKSPIKDDKFEKIVEELFPDELIHKEMTIERELCNPVFLSSNLDQEIHLQSPPPTDIISLAWSMAVLSSDNNLESEATESTISYDDLTNDVSSSDPIQETNQKTPEPMKRSWKNPEYRKMRAEAIKRSWEEEENRRKKKSECMKRNWENPDFRKKAFEASQRRWKDPERRKKQSEHMKQVWEDPEYRKKMSESMKNKNYNEEARRKMSEAKKGKKLSEEIKRKMSEAKKGKRHTQEAKQKMSETRTGRHLTQETRENISQAKKGQTYCLKNSKRTYSKRF